MKKSLKRKENVKKSIYLYACNCLPCTCVCYSPGMGRPLELSTSPEFRALSNVSSMIYS